jgi:hypothetical protein
MATVMAKPEQQKPEPMGPRVDEKLMRSGKYEITKETIFKVEVHLKEKDGRWILMVNKGRDIESHEVVFRMWNYDEMVELKKLATSYDSTKRMHMIDNDSLNRFKIQRMLMSWTFDRDNPRLKLFHVQGVMTDESWKVVSSLQPNILSYIIEEMNKVYEFNG